MSVVYLIVLSFPHIAISAKGRTNFDLRDQLLLDDTSQTMQIFALQRSGSGRISPFPTATTKRRQNDAGYASSTSSGICPLFSLSGYLEQPQV